MNTHKSTTYDLITESESEDKNRTLLETVIYALFTLSAIRRFRQGTTFYSWTLRSINISRLLWSLPWSQAKRTRSPPLGGRTKVYLCSDRGALPRQAGRNPSLGVAPLFRWISRSKPA